MQVRGAGERARSLKVKGEEIWEMVKLAECLDKEGGRDGVLDMVYCLCRHRSTGSDAWSAFSSLGRSLMTAPSRFHDTSLSRCRKDPYR